MAYVTAQSPADCLFCEKLIGSADEKNLILCRRPNAFVVLNAFPYSSGHLMVAPNRHVAKLERLSSEEATETMTLGQAAVRALTAVYHPDGFNLGMNLGSAAGAGVPGHLHLHVVPRWLGDTNFMPVLGQVKVMPETLETTFEKLLPHFT